MSVADADPHAQAQRSTPVELLWDLVFAFAITQVATLLAGDLTWAGFGRSMLILALVWWAWSAFAWAANAEAEDSVALRAVLLPATAFIFVAGLAIPRAFSGEGTLFAACYAVVRGLHLLLYADASRRGNASWTAIAGFAVTVALGMVLLLVGSFATGLLRDGLWAAALAIDYAGPAWLTRERLRGLQRVAVAHFAERYGLFVLICLGESIVSVGTGALSGARTSRPLTVALVTGVAFALVVAIALWWVYFDRSAALAERRLREHDDPVLAAADAYSYLHLPIVAGIVVYAVGAKLLVHRASGGGLPVGDRLALCGGIALYLIGHVAFRLRLGEGRLPWRVGAILTLAIVCAAGGGLRGWAFLAIVAAVMTGLCVAETVAGESPWPPRSSAPT